MTRTALTALAPEAAALRARKAYILQLLRNRPGEPHALADIRKWIRDVDAYLARGSR